MKINNILLLICVFIVFTQCKQDEINDFDRGNSIRGIDGNFNDDLSLRNLGDTITYEIGIEVMNSIEFVDIWVEQSEEGSPTGEFETDNKVLYLKTYYPNTYNAKIDDHIIIDDHMIGVSNYLVCKWTSAKAGTYFTYWFLGDFVE